MIEPSSRTTQSRAKNPAHPSLKALLVLAAALIAFIASDKYFTFLDDETTIVTAARQPVSQTLHLFWTGQGQHEHPPLSDVLLHLWLPIGGSAPWLLRLPSVVFYLAGLYTLACAARRLTGLAGPDAFLYAVYLGVLSPFAFHFARMAGWYSFCFLLAAAITLAYLRYLEKPDWKRLAVFIAIAAMLVYSNYYGWALIACLALDISHPSPVGQAISSPASRKRFLIAVFAILIPAYAPICAVFLQEILNGTHLTGGQPLISRILNSVYCLYALLVSESVAPWFWIASIPISLAILLSLTATIILLSKRNRRFPIYFALLFGGMSILGIIGTKRLLFISPWLLLSFSIALANREMKRARTTLALSLAFIAAAGWAGILARKYYAAPHFIEPWAEIAEQAATSAQHGDLVIDNSPSFRFYANYALRDHGMLRTPFSPGWVEDPRIAGVEQFPNLHIPASSSVLFIKGVDFSFPEQTAQVEAWLQSNCTAVSTRELVLDSGYPLKSRFFSASAQPQFRISLERYRCSLTARALVGPAADP